jgi:uncharacterized protein YjbI with pentapeptide repeats
MVWSDLLVHWSGFYWYTIKPTPEQLQEGEKTIWDWLELLVIPLAIAISALIFSSLERKNEQNIAQKRRQEDRAIADLQLEEDRRIEDERAQEAALQLYLEQMSALLIDKELRTSTQEDEVRIVGRAWTLNILRRVKTSRKGTVVSFLFESGLITEHNTLAPLRGADLQEIVLQRAELPGVNLGHSNLARASLQNAWLGRAYLEGANLQGANLQGAILTIADLQGANLQEADLRGTVLTGANLTWAFNLESANLEQSRYDKKTQWPIGFDPASTGAIRVEE